MTSAWKSVSQPEPCTICGHDSWCRVSADGLWTICRRVQAPGAIDKEDCNGAPYYVYGNPGSGTEHPVYEVPPEPRRGDPSTLDHVYRALLGRLTLEPRHMDALRSRGLDDEQVHARLYRTFPREGRSRVAKGLLDTFGAEILGTVPGLYVKTEGERSWRTIAGSAGLLVPVLDVEGRIVALKVRADDEAAGPRYSYISSTKRGGPGPGAPIHVPHFDGGDQRDEVRLTEGELKADVATAISEVLTISVPGISNWRPALESLSALSARTVRIAFDADWRTNPNVARAQLDLSWELQQRGLQVLFELWPSEHGKGIDDVIAARHEVEVVSFDEGRAAIAAQLDEGSIMTIQADSDWAPPAPFLEEVEPETFPVEIFPEWVRDHVTSEGDYLQIPPDLPAALIFGMTSAAMTGKLCIEVDGGWHEPLNTYSIISLPPGDRKSAAFKRSMFPIYKYEKEIKDSLSERIESTKQQKSVRQKSVSHWEGKVAKAATEPDRKKAEAALKQARDLLAGVEVPVAPRLTADDITTEKLADVMAAHGERVAVLSSEADLLDIIGGRYSRDGQANIGLYLKGFTGDPLRVDRVNRDRPPIFMSSPLITLCLTTQPEVIEGLSQQKSFRGRGLLARITFYLPRSLVGSRVIVARRAPDLDMYQQVCRDLLDFDPTPYLDPDQKGPATVKITLEARHALDEFRRELEPRMGPHGDLSSLADWCNRAPGHAIRHAGLLHILDRAGRGYECLLDPLDANTMQRGIALVRNYLLPHAQRAFAVMGSDPAESAAKAIVEYTRRKAARDPSWDQVLTVRMLLADLRGRFPNALSLDGPLRSLVDRGYARERYPERKATGRPPRPVYEINPLAIQDPDQGPAPLQHVSETSETPDGPSSAGSADVLLGGGDENDASQGGGKRLQGVTDDHGEEDRSATPPPGKRTFAGSADVLKGEPTPNSPENSPPPPLQQFSKTSETPGDDTLAIDLPDDEEEAAS